MVLDEHVRAGKEDAVPRMGVLPPDEFLVIVPRFPFAGDRAPGIVGETKTGGRVLVVLRLDIPLNVQPGHASIRAQLAYKDASQFVVNVRRGPIDDFPKNCLGQEDMQIVGLNDAFGFDGLGPVLRGNDPINGLEEFQVPGELDSDVGGSL